MQQLTTLKLAGICALFLLYGSFRAAAQTVYAEYWDGQVFIKIADKATVTLPVFEAGVSDARQYPLLSEMIDKYKIQRIFRPFEKLKTPMFNRTYALHFSDAAAVDALLRDLSALNWVEYAEKVPYERLCLVPNDPFITNNTQWHISKVDAFDAWDLATGSANVVVAIVDDGVRLTHEDLAANIWTNTGEIAGNGLDDDGNGYVDDVNGWDGGNNDNNPNPPSGASNFYFSHGTHCAGIAAAVTNNAKGGGAISHNVKVMACKGARDSDASLSGIWTAFTYAMNNYPEVISCSWGGGGYAQTYQNIVNEARNRGILVIAAAGNDNTNSVFYPAGYNNVISVASSNQSDQKSSFSNYGSWIDITAPGSSIRSTVATSNTSYEYYDGTSMACPNVASLAGLIFSYNPSFGPAEVENCILTGADNINSQNPGYVGLLGAGRMNAFNSLQCANPSGCLVPGGLGASQLTATSVTLSWNIMPNALSYNIRYRETGATTWVNSNGITANSLALSGLTPCTQYEYQVQSVCSSEQSSFSSVRTFGTPPAGLLNYCTAKGNNVAYEWIAGVALNTIANNSGANGGYADFRCIGTVLQQGNSYNITLTPGFAGQTYTEYWRIWIDLNQNGTFDDPSERLYSSAQATANVVNASLTVPTTALTGPTTMRVVMKWVASSDNTLPSACGTFAYGEVEDYAVNITSTTTPTPTCNTPASVSTTNVGNNQATLQWAAVTGAGSYNIQWRQAGTTTWQTVNSNTNSYILSALTTCTQYEFQVQTVCTNGLSSSFSSTATFTTTGCVAPCNAPTGLSVSAIGTTTATLNWAAAGGAQSYNLQYRYVGAPTWQTVNTAATSQNLTGLTECLNYEWQVQTVCSASAQSSFSALQNFSTACGNTCNIPGGIQATNITNTSTKIIWNAVPGATAYEVRLRLVGNTTWITATIYDLDADFTGGSTCQQYQFQIRTVCGTGTTSEWSNSLYFTLAGCSGYCEVSAQNSTNEWIQSVQVANISNTSGNNGGYANFTNLNIQVYQDSIFNFTLTPGFGTQTNTQYWRIWIDWNKDFDFEDAGEMVYDSGTFFTNPATGLLTIAPDAPLGATRMRIAMKRVNSSLPTLPFPCLAYTYGEFEDYTITVFEPVAPPPPPPPPPAPVMVAKLIVFLEGCYSPDDNLMTTILNTQNLIPEAQPFFREPWFYDGTEAVANPAAIPSNIVDWVLVEAFDPANLFTPVARKAAFLRNNGQIVDIDGTTEGVNLPDLEENAAYIFTVRPRSHMAVMTRVALTMPSVNWYNFSESEFNAMGTNQQKAMPDGVFALYAGDFDHNGVINYADANQYISEVNQTGQYLNADANKDGRTLAEDYQLLRVNTGTMSISILRY